jgi:hypothetical protein
MLLVDEYFGAEDARFVEELRRVHKAKALAQFAERWKRDPRPWAREQVLKYLQLPLDQVGHQSVVKRLFKQAERSRDDEQMGAFLVAFDRLVRRYRAKRYRYDWRSRQSWTEEILRTPRNTVPHQDTRVYRHPRTGEDLEYPARVPRHGRLFRYRTRKYLRRRAWRYFRRMGYQRPADYPGAVARALTRYGDEDLARGEHVLECWALLHACFHNSDALDFSARRVALREGRTLAELAPAPYFPALWRKPESLPVLLRVLVQAESRFVRLWTMDMVRQHHIPRLGEMAVGELIQLLEHGDPEVQQFGSELLGQSPALQTLAVDVWLRLLTVNSPTALAAICDLMRRHVARERLTLAQCVELACVQAAPVAHLGFDFLKQTVLDASRDREAIVRLAGARCPAIGRELAGWALGIVGGQPAYDRDVVIAFLDSLLAEMREGAWDWLVRGSPGADDPALFSRLLETPFDDIRLRLIDHLQAKARIPAIPATELTRLWSAVLLGVHRGGRQKVKAVGQLAEALADQPDRAPELLPVLVVAVRSIRPTEWRAGLAALMRLVDRRPELESIVAGHLPELKLLEPPSWT